MIFMQLKAALETEDHTFQQQLALCILCFSCKQYQYTHLAENIVSKAVLTCRTRLMWLVTALLWPFLCVPITLLL